MKSDLINALAGRLAGIFIFALGWTYFYALPPLLTAENEAPKAISTPSSEAVPATEEAGSVPMSGWQTGLYLGSNSFHHHALENIRKLKTNPVLVLIDAHSDVRPSASLRAGPSASLRAGPSGDLNCGNWVRYAQEDGLIKKTVWLGGALGISGECDSWFSYESIANGKLYPFPARISRAYFKTDASPLSGLSAPGAEYVREERRDEIGAFFGFPGVSVKWYSWKDAVFRGFLKSIIADDDVYVSLDLDVLTKEEAPTPWGNGLMEMSELKEILDYLNANFRIIGWDVCGPEKAAEEIMSYAKRF